MTQIDEKNLEITFSAASSIPYERYEEETGMLYAERLEISENAINFDRLLGGASILRNHDRNDILGVVTDAYIEAGKLMIRAKFRANSPEAVAVFKDASAGTLPNVSIGYTVDRFVDSTAEGKIYRDVTAWTPFEVSVAVGVPADASVGFFRSFELPNAKGKAMEEKETAPEEVKEQTPPEQAEEKELEQECSGECKECKKRNECANAEEAETADEETKEGEETEENAEADPEAEAPKPAPEETKADLRRHFTRKAVEAKSVNIISGGKREMNTKYSLVRAFQSLLTGSQATVEREASDALYRSAGFEVPKNRLMIRAGEFYRDGEFDGSAGVGAALIGTDHRADEYIKILRTRMGVKGARVLGGLKGNQEIPVQTAASTIGFGKINGEAGKTKPTVSNVTLTPKKFSAYTEVAEDLIAQGNPDAIAIVMDDLNQQLIRKIDLAILNGVDNDTDNVHIAGVDGTTGVQTVTVADLSAITWKQILEFGGKIADYEIDPNSVAWITKGTHVQDFKGISKDTGSGRFLLEDNRMDGHEVNVCGALSAGSLYLGDWSNVIIGQWGGLEIRLDDITGLQSGKVKVFAKLLCDIVITRPNAFVKRVAPGSN